MKPVEKVAVIDVGSNSCRLVIYERSGDALLPYFNEKSMAGLGRGLPETGHLSPEGRENAIATFHRFKSILDGLGIERVYAAATSAVREASDGVDFRLRAEEALGVELSVLSGADEGRLSALGVNLGFDRPKGIVADLGGSSMELYPVGKHIGEGETYLLGPLARQADEALSVKQRGKIAKSFLRESKLLEKQSKHLFAVGGAWRNLAAVDMMLKGYPLRVVHSYQLNQKSIHGVIEAASGAEHHKDIRERLLKVSKKRFDTLLHSAIILNALLEVSKADKITISAYGLRDGVVAEKLGFGEQDGLLDSIPLFLRSPQTSTDFGRELFSFVAPIRDKFSQTDSVLEATCLMADAGARMHPDHRANLVHSQILRAPVPTFDHEARLFSAYAAASRYTYKLNAPPEITAVMSDALINDARAFGTAMRLAGVYSGRSGKILRTAKLIPSLNSLKLQVARPYSDLVSDTVKRRHAQLSNLLGLEPEFELA